MLRHAVRAFSACAALAATLALSAAPAMAQVPEIGLRIVFGLNDMTMEGADCVPGNSDGISISVGQANPATPFASAVDARVFAVVLSGHNRFADRHGGKFLKRADNGELIAPKNAGIGSRGRVTWAAGARSNRLPLGEGGQGICWSDDNLDTGDTEVMIVIANGPGYTVDPEESRHTFTIRDNDDCANPAATPGGVVYKINGGRTCICATESRVSDVRRALKRPTNIPGQTVPTPGPDGQIGTDDDGTAPVPFPPASTDFLRSLAGNFHDPSYLYCEESPYKGLPE